MKKILIIEDDKDIARGIAEWLELKNFSVVSTNNGKSGIKEARSHDCSLILLDIKLPGINGFEVCKILKQDSKTAQIPIIIFTSLDSVDDVEAAFEAGANDYLTKPFEFERLFMKIKKLIGDSAL